MSAARAVEPASARGEFRPEGRVRARAGAAMRDDTISARRERAARSARRRASAREADARDSRRRVRQEEAER